MDAIELGAIELPECLEKKSQKLSCLASDVPTSVSMADPIFELRDLLRRNGIKPLIELAQIDGPIHKPTLVYYVISFENFDVMGKGQTKKEAVTCAAKKLLQKLSKGPLSTPLNEKSSSNNDNPISELHRICDLNRSLGFPIYGEIQSNDADVFAITCCVNGHRTIGHGTRKKIAKHEASKEMLRKILEN